MGKLQTLSLAALIVIIIGFILDVVGVGTAGWVSFNGVSGIGLSSGTSDSRGQAAYALCIISTLGAAAALTAIAVDVLLQLIDKATEKLTHLLPLITLVAAVVGGIFGIVGAIIHAAWMGDSTGSTGFGIIVVSYSYTPGYSFFLTIIGCIILIVGGGVAYKAKKGGHIDVGKS